MLFPEKVPVTFNRDEYQFEVQGISEVVLYLQRLAPTTILFCIYYLGNEIYERELHINDDSQLILEIPDHVLGYLWYHQVYVLKKPVTLTQRQEALIQQYTQSVTMQSPYHQYQHPYPLQSLAPTNYPMYVKQQYDNSSADDNTYAEYTQQQQVPVDAYHQTSSIDNSLTPAASVVRANPATTTSAEAHTHDGKTQNRKKSKQQQQQQSHKGHEVAPDGTDDHSEPTVVVAQVMTIPDSSTNDSVNATAVGGGDVDASDNHINTNTSLSPEVPKDSMATTQDLPFESKPQRLRKTKRAAAAVAAVGEDNTAQPQPQPQPKDNDVVTLSTSVEPALAPKQHKQRENKKQQSTTSATVAAKATVQPAQVQPAIVTSAPVSSTSTPSPAKPPQADSSVDTQPSQPKVVAPQVVQAVVSPVVSVSTQHQQQQPSQHQVLDSPTVQTISVTNIEQPATSSTTSKKQQQRKRPVKTSSTAISESTTGPDNQLDIYQNDPLAVNPDASLVGLPLTYLNISIPSNTIKWLHTGATITQCHGSYREALYQHLYKDLTLITSDDPLKAWNLYCPRDHLAIHLFTVDTTALSQNQQTNLGELRRRVENRIQLIAEYDQRISNHNMDTNNEENQFISPIPVRNIAYKKLIRIGVPSTIAPSQLIVAYQCKQYANELGVNLLIDILN